MTGCLRDNLRLRALIRKHKSLDFYGHLTLFHLPNIFENTSHFIPSLLQSYVYIRIRHGQASIIRTDDLLIPHQGGKERLGTTQRALVAHNPERQSAQTTPIARVREARARILFGLRRGCCVVYRTSPACPPPIPWPSRRTAPSHSFFRTPTAHGIRSYAGGVGAH